MLAPGCQVVNPKHADEIMTSKPDLSQILFVCHRFAVLTECMG